MTKWVLRFGAVALALLLPLWLFFDVIPEIGRTGHPKIDEAVSTFRVIAAMLSMGSRGTVFSGLEPMVLGLLFLLVIAVISDYLFSLRDRSAVRPFARVLAQSEPGDPVQQTPATSLSDADFTNTSGNFGGRSVNVILKDRHASRIGDSFRVDVSCDCRFTFSIRRKGVLSWLGTKQWALVGCDDPVVASGDPEFDAAILVQSIDSIPVHHWLKDPTVRQTILSLFQHHNIASVDTGPGVLEAELPTNNPLLLPTTDAAGLTSALCVLAASAESMPTWLAKS